MTAARGWYPWIISNAVTQIDDLPEFLTLPGNFSQVLRRLIKKVSKDNGQQPIFAQRETIAREIGKSVSTVYRALHEFEARGWIQLREMKSRFGLLGSDSEIVFSATLCNLLQLPLALPTAGNPSTVKPPVNNDRPKEVITPLLNTKQSDEFSVKKEAGKIRIDRWMVPHDLAWLVLEGQLSVPGLFSLMVEAKKKGGLLSDIVAVTQKTLREKKLHGRELFAYLFKLATKTDSDFSFLARKTEENAEKEKEKLEVKLQRALLEQRFHDLIGKSYRSVSSGNSFVIEKQYIRIIANGKEQLAVWDAHFFDRIEQGDVVPFQIGLSDVEKTSSPMVSTAPLGIFAQLRAALNNKITYSTLDIRGFPSRFVK